MNESLETLRPNARRRLVKKKSDRSVHHANGPEIQQLAIRSQTLSWYRIVCVLGFGSSGFVIYRFLKSANIRHLDPSGPKLSGNKNSQELEIPVTHISSARQPAFFLLALISGGSLSSLQNPANGSTGKGGGEILARKVGPRLQQHKARPT